jgi:hypothetical protein
MIHRQSHPPPKPLLPFPPQPPQQQSRRIIHRQELPPNPEEDSHPHPQFVALKSLMLLPPFLLFTMLYYVAGLVSVSWICRKNVKKKKERTMRLFSE